VREHIESKALAGVRIRGLKVNVTDPSQKLAFCDAEYLLLNDEGASNLVKIIEHFASRINYSSLRVFGDVHLNNFGIYFINHFYQNHSF
jgi:D-mannonate dehydratase